MPAPGGDSVRKLIVTCLDQAGSECVRSALVGEGTLEVISVESFAAIAAEPAARTVECAIVAADRLPEASNVARRGEDPPRPWLIVAVDRNASQPSDALCAGVDDAILLPCPAWEIAARVRRGLAEHDRLAAAEHRALHLGQVVNRQSEFLSVVSHEIRTPLSAIMSSANILMRYGAQRPESVERFSRVIVQEGRRLTRMINNLLDLAKIEAGEVEWQFQAVHPDELLRQVGESFEALVGERNLTLELGFCAAARSVRVDHDKMVQVLVNLVFNAIKHSPDGATVFLRCLRPDAGVVRLEVEDQGPGIPQGLEDHIFERFQQADAGPDRSGTGLGLTISRHIVEQHGGRIWAARGRKTGALLVVELPAADPERVDDGSVR